jgi:hypothetical protein
MTQKNRRTTMPNYNTHFSEVIPHLTEEERAWLERALQDPGELGDQEYEAWREEFGDLFEEPECGHGFGHEFDDDTEWGNYLWLYSDDSGSVENVLALVQAFLERFRPGQTWSITWAQTCSKPLVGEFGGGWAVVTAERVESGSAWSMAEECKRTLERNLPGNEASRPCPYCSAPVTSSPRSKRGASRDLSLCRHEEPFTRRPRPGPATG